jgi:rubrerythrin
MAVRKGPERVEHMVAVLRQWQEVERKTVSILTEILEKSQNPLVALLMEIIRQDSLTHHRVQQFLVESVTVSAPSLSRQELAEVWDMIEKHDAGEKQALELAKQLLEEAWTPVQKQLLGYLLKDEAKHEELLAQLEDMKKDMSRSSGA